MIGVTIDTADFDRAQRLMQAAPKTFTEQMRLANMESSAALVRRIKEGKLRGQVLNRISGTLLRSWAAKVPPMPLTNGWLGGGGTNLDYAIAHEFGVDKVKAVQVRAHTRRVTQVYGRPVQNVLAEVRTFPRQQHTKLRERRYARASLEEIRDKVREIHRSRATKAEEKLKGTA